MRIRNILRAVVKRLAESFRNQLFPEMATLPRRPHTFSELVLIHPSVTIYMDGQDKQDKNMVSECLRFTQIFAD